VPFYDDAEKSKALVGSMADSLLSDPVKKLITSETGFAYLVDRHGRVIFHPDPTQIGVDYRQRPAVRQVTEGKSGGSLWIDPTGERLVEGFAPIPVAGWGLLIQESWASVIAPVQIYGVVMTGAGLGLIALVEFPGKEAADCDPSGCWQNKTTTNNERLNRSP
jgi:hypothetical protein